MEVILFFWSVIGIGEVVNNHQDRIEQLEAQVELQQKWIEDLEQWNSDQDVAIDRLDEVTLKQAGAHSAFYAGQQLVNDTTKAQIEKILKELSEKE